MKLSFFVYFEGYIEFFDDFLLYFPLQRDIFFRLWHAKINQAFCWFFLKPFNLVKRSPLFSLQSADNVNIKFTKMDRLIFTNLDRII